MKIYGLDFTSAPGEKKPIACARCHLNGETLHLDEISFSFSFNDFEILLKELGPCVAGLDFPFGQPRKLIDNLSWPKTWEGYVSMIGEMTKENFVTMLGEYRRSRPKGDKQHLRRTDELAKSRSPMMLYGVPVGKMFFEGAPRLLKSEACIRPCHPNDDPRILIEAYPALVARRWSNDQSYKSDERREQTAARQNVREAIVKGLRTDARSHFGLDIQIPDLWAKKCIQDGSGDTLDAWLCAIQAGWGWYQREKNFGIPVDCDAGEGWIVDPILVLQHNVGQKKAGIR